MWLVTTLIAAIAVTAIWYVKPKIYKLDILSLMLWGTSIMILVDHILGYEGGEFIELETEGSGLPDAALARGPGGHGLPGLYLLGVAFQQGNHFSTFPLSSKMYRFHP